MEKERNDEDDEEWSGCDGISRLVLAMGGVREALLRQARFNALADDDDNPLIV